MIGLEVMLSLVQFKPLWIISVITGLVVRKFKIVQMLTNLNPNLTLFKAKP